MKRAPGNSRLVYVLSPVAVISIIAGLWITVSAAYENIRLGKGENQILAIVSTAREASLDSSVTQDRATYSLLQRLSSLDGMQVMSDDPKSWPYLTNPWGEKLGILVQPAQKQLILSSQVNASVCQKLIQFLSKDLESLEVKNIIVQDLDPLTTQSFSLYNSQSAENVKRAVTPSIINKACSGTGKELMAINLTFSLH